MGCGQNPVPRPVKSMKWASSLFYAAILIAPVRDLVAETAQARMYCFSPRFQRSSDQTTFFTLDLTTLAVGVNGELAFGDFFGTGSTHSSFLVLTDQLFSEVYDGAMALNVPTGGDANGNSYPDFYEVARAVSSTSSGLYEIDGIGNGAVSASWSRGAGSRFGSCVLTFHNSSFGNLVFSAVFELLEYAGPLVYNPGSNMVSGTINLTQTGSPENQMQGPVQFVKVPSNRYNRLVLQSGVLTNSSEQSLNFTTNLFLRDVNWPTNYGGYFDFEDWDPNTSDLDYLTWGLSINDTNDFNHNGIPNFSDDPPGPLPRRPVLSLLRTATNYLLTIQGDVGHLHQVQETLILPATNWQTIASVTLTNDPQTISLPLSAARMRLWRVLTQ
jgi:hypothetical protein